MAAASGHAEEAAQPAVNVAVLESLGRDVIAAICTAREMLSSQTATLAEYRNALASYRNGLVTEREELDRHKTELVAQLERREGEMTRRDQRVAERERQGDEREQSLGEVQALAKNVEARMQEISQREAAVKALEEQVAAAQNRPRRAGAGDGASTSALEFERAPRRRVDAERQKRDEHKSDPSPRHGENESVPAAANAGMPTIEEQRARESLARFQKLCRDAKRKSIGAG